VLTAIAAVLACVPALARASAVPAAVRIAARLHPGARYLAVAADGTPNDTGTASRSQAAVGGWVAAQWDLTGPYGIRAPQAWAVERRPGNRVVVAVLDTGIAYSDRAPYHRSPDIAPSSVVRGWDFVDNDPYPNDRNGHGTFVASVIAAAANNGYGMVGIAYDAKIMPVRVLDGDGTGTGGRIARGIRWAVNHGAQVINVSIELYDRFTLDPQSMTTDPAIRSAVSYAGAHHVLVVAAAGNAQSALVPSTRLGSDILYVGGSTEHGCLGDYSNYGPGMDIVAPGGGSDAAFAGDPRCTPDVRGRNILEVSFKRPYLGRFKLVRDSAGRPGFKGTSMAAPHATAAAALLIASGQLGAHPSPAAIQARLRGTALDLGAPGPDRHYGSGLLDVAAALGVPR